MAKSFKYDFGQRTERESLLIFPLFHRDIDCFLTRQLTISQFQTDVSPRDRVLAGYRTGKKLIKLYYKNDKRIIKVFDKNPTIKKSAKKLLESLIPLIEFLEFLNSRSYQYFYLPPPTPLQFSNLL